ncbi:MAG: sensor domain-containing protein, partial [Desulfocucumaceae bacterium]
MDSNCTPPDYFKAVFDSTPAGLIIFEISSHKILEINPFMINWLGYECNELLHAKIEDLFEIPSGEFRKDYQNTGQVKGCRCRKKNGEFVNVDLIANTLRLKDTDCILILIRDDCRYRSEFELRQSAERFRSVFEGAVIGITLADMEGRPIESNPALQEMLGYNSDELRKMLFAEFTHPDDTAADLALHKELVAGRRNRFQMEKRYIRKDGRIFWARLSVSLVRGDKGEPQSVIGMVEDINEQKLAQEKLLSAHRQMMEVIDFLPDATFVVDGEEKVIAWNRAMEEMTGLPKEMTMGKDIYKHVLPYSGFENPILINQLFAKDWEYEHWYENVERRNSTLFAETFVPEAYQGRGAHVWISASPLFDSNGSIVGAIEIIRDITERNRMKERLEYMATHDFLTSIPNRYTLEENVRRAVSKAKRGYGSAFLFIDIDNFKLVNDTLGHAAGDEMLITMANILRANLREGDLLARLGGDEFAVILEGVSLKEARDVAEKLRLVVDREELCLTTHKTCFTLTISIGVVMIDGTQDSQKLLSYADTALYSAKDGGRNKIAFLNPDEFEVDNASETNQMISLIKRAFKENRFVLYYQPVQNLEDGSIAHHEALIRMVDPNGLLILPGRFIPVAERFGLMSQIDRWVVQTAFSTLQTYPELKLYVNLSGTTLGDDDLLEIIEVNLHETGIDPSRLGFEITETAAVKDFLRAERWINRLKKLGCRFALDDFGIGFSSFTYLR